MKSRTIVYVATAVVAASVAFAFVACSDTSAPPANDTLAASLAEEADAIEEIYEPFLIQIGFLNRTPRGRVATQLAYDHFGITPTRRQSSLF